VLLRLLMEEPNADLCWQIVATLRYSRDDKFLKLVRDLNPPADAEKETDKIADALHAFADEFGKMEKAARAKDKDALQQAQQAVITEGAAAQQAANDLKAKGYDIGELGPSG